MGTHPIFESDFDCLTDLQSANLFAMGISRDSEHKRRATGGKRPQTRKKRAFLLGRPSSMTKLAPHRVHHVRTRGGNMKYRALRLDQGNFSWATEAVARKVRVIDVVYNASNNELVRTKTLVKGCMVTIDSTPFRQWYESHYAKALGRKKNAKLTEEEEALFNGPKSAAVQKKLDARRKEAEVAAALVNNSPKVVSLPVLLPDQVKLADATDTSLKAKNSTSTSENSRPRNPNKCKDSNK